MKVRLQDFLFPYRNTPHSITGKAPTELIFGRRLTCLLDYIRPNTKPSLQFKQFQANIDSDQRTPDYKPGEAVYTRAKNKDYIGE